MYSAYETKLGAFRLAPNEPGYTSTPTSTLNVDLKQAKKGNISADNEGKSSTTDVKAENDSSGRMPETPLHQQSTEDEEKLLSDVHARKISDSDISHTFCTDYLSSLTKEDVENSSPGIQVLFNQEAEVYFFIEDEGVWRKRGNGILQILRSNHGHHMFMSDHVRMCVAHEITASMDLKPNAGSDRSWVWFTLADYSDTQVVAREIAAEFQSVVHSFEFKKIFEECRDACGVPHEGHVQAMAASFDSNTHKLPSHDVDTPLKREVQGFWRICPGCKVENNVENTSCAVCGERFTGDIATRSARKPQMKVTPSCTRKFKKPIPTPKNIVVKELTVQRGKYKPVIQWWKCLSCRVENNKENPSCLVCSRPYPQQELSCSPEISEMLKELL